MRRLCAMVLTCEALVIALAIPVAIAVGGTDAKAAGIAGGVLALLAIVLAGMLKRPWAIAAGSGFQVLVIASGFVVSAMFFLGALFAALWGCAIYLGRRVEGPQAR